MAYERLTPDQAQNILGHKPLDRELFFHNPNATKEHPGITLLSSL